MRNYTVYFEIYGKKMKVKVPARSMTEAQDTVRNKIIFHKTVADDDEWNKAVDIMGKIDGIIKKKSKKN